MFKINDLSIYLQFDSDVRSSEKSHLRLLTIQIQNCAKYRSVR